MQSTTQAIRKSHEGNPPSFFYKKSKIPIEKNIQIALDNTRVLIYQIEHVSEVYKESEIVLENLAHIQRVLEKLENQLNFIQSVLNTVSCEEVEALKLENEILAKSYGNLKKKEDFSRVPLEDGIIFLINNLLPEADKSLSKSFQILADGHVNVIKPEDKIFEMQLITTKLLMVHTFLPRLAMFDKKDLIAIERTAFIWRELREFSTFKDYVTKDKIEESMRNSFLKFDKGLAVISSEGQENENDKIKNTFFRFQNVVWYSFKNFQTQAKLTLCLNDIKVEDAIAVWNLKERPLYKHIMKVRLPSIGFDNKIYVDRYFPRITKELILEEYEEETLCDEELLYLDVPDISQEKETVLEQISRNGDGKVQIRILYSESLDLKTTTIQDIKKFIKKHLNFSENKLANSIDHIPGIIIHIHGGGFVSSSSSTHREYLNRWTNTLNKVIFSIDYRLAPQNPYPSALDDVWQAYLWILHFSELILGIPSEKIILVGDCSGGNLALALCLRLIKANLKLPHGCLLIYPILNLDSQKFSPSYFFSIGDPLLPYNLLKPCIEAYTTKDFNPKIDPYLSPIIAPDEFLTKLPPIRILTGSKDPVYDDSWRLVDRLRKVGQNVHLTIQEDMFHGFLRSEDLANYEMLVADGSKLIQELFLIGDQSVN